MTARTRQFILNSPEETSQLAAALGATLVPGDVILLSGDVGAGKTHFARALIRSLLEHPEDVPSPTFTLVQVYDSLSGPIWHCDLYRVTSTWEIEELGLGDAFSDAICLVEWPDRLGDLRPVSALELEFRTGETDLMRHLEVRWTDPAWDSRTEAAA